MAPLPQRPNVYNTKLPDPKGHQEDSLRYLAEVNLGRHPFLQYFPTGERWSSKGNLGAGHNKSYSLGDKPAQVHHSLWAELPQS